MCFKARCQALLLSREVFLLLQQFLLLGNHAAHFRAQVCEFFFQQVDGFLGVGLFAFIMSAKALQQGFGLMIRSGLPQTGHG